ncbi:MAG: DNA-processing protein DprA, partial [Butyrivibrio sp.]|nr:DNA-processing protein DprA [Butyrivibrio sp.]
MELSEKDYAYWLFNVEGIGNASADKLLCSGLSCREVYQMGTKELTGLLSRKKAERIEKSRYSWDFEAEKKKLEEKGINFVSRIDPEFPEKLKNIPGAPFAIYVKGSLPDPRVPSVSIVGARMCSEYGRYMARQFGRGLALAGVQVISGMARGIDGIAQGAAIEA